MSKINGKGKVVFQSIEGGFWGIEDTQGNQYRPVNMPKQLQKEGMEVSFVAKEVDEMGIFMWGLPVKIISFNTLKP